MDSQIKFEAHIRKVSKTIKTNLNCFWHIRPCLSIKAPNYTVYARHDSNAFFLLCNCLQPATQSAMKPIMLLYKQATGILDQRPIKLYHCKIHKKYNLLSFEKFINYVNGLALELVSEMILKYKSKRAVSGECKPAKTQNIRAVLFSSFPRPTDLEYPAIRNKNINWF